MPSQHESKSLSKSHFWGRRLAVCIAGVDDGAPAETSLQVPFLGEAGGLFYRLVHETDGRQDRALHDQGLH